MSKKSKKPKDKSLSIIDKLKRKAEKMGVTFNLASEITQESSYVSSGSLLINEAIGAPGYPCGKITELVGPESSGKSLLTLLAEAVVTQRQKYVLHLDLERNHDKVEFQAWRKHLGVDLKYVIQPEFTIAEKLMQSSLETIKLLGEDLQLIVVDSISAFVPEKIDKKDVGESTVAVEAKLLHRWFDKLRLDNTHAAVLCINQLTSNISGYGNPVSKGGGWAMRFDPHLSLKIHGDQVYSADSDEKGSLGLDMTITVAKNKVGAPKRVCHPRFRVALGGFDLTNEVLELSVRKGLIRKNPPYYYLGEQAFQGHEKMQAHIASDKKLLRSLITKLGYNPSQLGA